MKSFENLVPKDVTNVHLAMIHSNDSSSRDARPDMQNVVEPAPRAFHPGIAKINTSQAMTNLQLKIHLQAKEGRERREWSARG